MKNRLLSGVLAATGILALSATVAHAGGTGNPVALTSFFVCHQINGVSLGTVVDIYSNEAGAGGAPTPPDPNIPASRTNVTLGQSILACAQAFLFKAGVKPNVDPSNGNFTNNISPALARPPGVPNPDTFELKCYSASVSKKSGDDGLFGFEDPLFSDAFGANPAVPLTETVTDSRDPKLICAPAMRTR